MPSASERGLQGPRPHPLKVSKESLKAGKSPSSAAAAGSSSSSRRGPMIVYLDSPKVIHAKPQEFMHVVQKLTGKDAGERNGGGDQLCLEKEAGDPLLLTLGHTPSSSSPNLSACWQDFGSLF